MAKRDYRYSRHVAAIPLKTAVLVGNRTISIIDVAAANNDGFELRSCQRAMANSEQVKPGRRNSMKMTMPVLIMLAGIGLASPGLVAKSLKLPPEVTPALRAACERDVRRLCIDQDSTIRTVKACVLRRYGNLSTRCKLQLAASGLIGSRGGSGSNRSVFSEATP